jgi:hypothetical protein
MHNIADDPFVNLSADFNPYAGDMALKLLKGYPFCMALKSRSNISAYLFKVVVYVSNFKLNVGTKERKLGTWCSQLRPYLCFLVIKEHMDNINVSHRNHSTPPLPSPPPSKAASPSPLAHIADASLQASGGNIMLL